VLQALVRIAQDAHAVGKPVGVCGELAGDPGGAVLLMAMGYDSLSMNAASLPKVKAVIRSVSLEWATNLLEDVLMLDSPHVIKSCIDLALRNAGFGRYMRPGKSTGKTLAEVASASA
jgi:phosphotransferase system enzyme I (PtsP)